MKKISVQVDLEVDEEAFRYVYECSPRTLHRVVEQYVREAIVDTLAVQQGDMTIEYVKTVWP